MSPECKVREETTYNILLVDDDDVFRSTHRRLLNLFHDDDSHKSFDVTDVATGDDALDVLSHRRIDCVLMDYRLLDEDGLTLSREIMRRHPVLPVIMLTGAGSERLAAEAMRCGASDYLVKSGITLECLNRSITNAIERAHLMHTVEDQRKQLMDIERHRVMLKSLAAACHHLSQPLTVVKMALAMLQSKAELSEASLKLLSDATSATEEMSRIMMRLRHVDDYRTEPYTRNADGIVRMDDNEILSIEEEDI